LNSNFPQCFRIIVLHEKFDEKLPLTKSKQKLPVVLNRTEIGEMFEVTTNIKHKVVLALLYYAGLRSSEVRNLKWQDINFERGLIHIKQAKGEKERVVFLHDRLRELLTGYGMRKSRIILYSERGGKYNKERSSK